MLVIRLQNYEKYAIQASIMISNCKCTIKLLSRKKCKTIAFARNFAATKQKTTYVLNK